jgi:methylase of polypeptide subunit release factors
MKPDPAAVLASLAHELGPAASRLVPGDIATLAAAAGDDAQLRRWFKRRLTGEPVAHIVGQFTFRGLDFVIDKRAYVTDPELTHLVDAVIAATRRLAVSLGRPPLLADVGVGCGSLALSIQHAVPAVVVVGLDLDPDALAVAARNGERHGFPLRLVESDLFAQWPADLPAPDLIYGDPPWGDETMLYADDRPAGHYQAMPPASAFPLGGPTGVHEQILRSVAARGWASEIWLNGGVIPRAALETLGRLAGRHTIIETATGLSLLRCGPS